MLDKEYITPILKSKTVEDVDFIIMRVLLPFSVYRYNLFLTLQELLSNQNLLNDKSILFEMSEKIPIEVREKALKGLRAFSTASNKILKKIFSSPGENLYYFCKGPAVKLFIEASLIELLYFCYMGAEKTQVKPEILYRITDHILDRTNRYLILVDEIIKEWDVLTDISIMNAIEKDIEETKVGKLSRGSKTLQEFLTNSR